MNQHQCRDDDGGEQSAQIVMSCIESVLDDPYEMKDLVTAHQKSSKYWNVVSIPCQPQPLQQHHQQHGYPAAALWHFNNNPSNVGAAAAAMIMMTKDRNKIDDIPLRLRQIYKQHLWSIVESDELKLTLPQQLYYARHIPITVAKPAAAPPMHSLPVLMVNQPFNSTTAAGMVAEFTNSKLAHMKYLVQFRAQQNRMNAIVAAASALPPSSSVSSAVGRNDFLNHNPQQQICTFCKSNQEP